MYLFRSFALTAVLLALASCASIPSAGIDYAKAFPPDGGVVAVQVVTNSAHLSDALNNWTQVVVAREGGVTPDGKPELITIPALTDGLSTTRVFVGVLKPGRYRFAGLSSFAKPGDFSYFLNAGAPPTVGSFEVKTNYLTNLGTVLFQPFLPDPLATSMVNESQQTPIAMSRLEDAPSLTEFVSQRYPAQFRLTQANPQLGWTPDNLSALRTKLTSAIKAYAALSEPHYVSRTKEIVYTARLGTLYLRHVDGNWSACHVPTNYELLAFKELSDGAVLAGGERGNVWFASAWCGDWQAIPLPDKAQNVVWIGSGSSSDVVLALANEDGRFRIYTAVKGKWNWQLVKEFGQYDPPNYLFQALYVVPTPALYRRGPMLFLSAHSEAYTFDTDNSAFSPSASDSMLRATTQPDGTIVASPTSAWIGSKPPRVSRDDGKTWDQYQRLGKFTEAPYVFSNGDALATDDSTRFVLVGWIKNRTIDVLLSHDKGKTSTVIGHVPYGCDQLQTAISNDDLIFTRCFDGSLLRSTDRGKTWVTDFSRAVRKDSIPPEFLGNPFVLPTH